MSTGIFTGYRSIWQFSLAAVASLTICANSIILAGSDSALTAGERNPSLLCRYPKDVFHSLRMHFVVDQAASFPVVFEDFLHAGIRLQSGRPVAVQFADWARYQNACPDGNAQLFLSGVHGPDRKTNPDASGRLTLWGRSVNSEGRSLPFGISNMDCWIMGFKTERADLIWDVQGGSNLEVLGGTMGVAHPKDYFLIRDTSRLSAVANTSGFGLRGRERILRNEKPNALQRNLTTSDFPVRHDRPRQIFIPLLRVD